MRELRYTPGQPDLAVPAGTVVYLFRHGQTISDAENKFCGWTDEDLTPQGDADAKDAVDQVISKLTFGKVFSDAMVRTIHIARMALPYCKVDKEITVNNGANTWGIGDALSGQPKTADNLAKKQFYVEHPDVLPEGENAETINESKARWRSFLAYVISVTPVGMPSLICCHSNGVKVTGKTYGTKIKVNTTGVVRMTIYPDRIEFTILRNGTPDMVEPDTERSIGSILEELEQRAEELIRG